MSSALSRIQELEQQLCELKCCYQQVLRNTQKLTSSLPSSCQDLSGVANTRITSYTGSEYIEDAWILQQSVGGVWSDVGMFKGVIPSDLQPWCTEVGCAANVIVSASLSGTATLGTGCVIGTVSPQSITLAPDGGFVCDRIDTLYPRGGTPCAFTATITAQGLVDQVHWRLQIGVDSDGAGTEVLWEYWAPIIYCPAEVSSKSAWNLKYSNPNSVPDFANMAIADVQVVAV